MTKTSASKASKSQLLQFLSDASMSIEHPRSSSASGYLYLSLEGSVSVGEHTYRYHVIPTLSNGEDMPAACLGKRTRWNKLSADQKLEALGASAVTELRDAFAQEVQEACASLVSVARQQGLAQEQCHEAILALDSKDQTFFERLTIANDRISAVAQRARFEALADKTKEVINLADYPASFGMAHRMERKFVAILGEPNSGKTYEAMKALVAAKSGVYLAPLRLLALENYERLQEAGAKASMITGEECRVQEGATHIASTIEMMDFSTPVDVAVIDEVQTLDDPHRGAAWTAAICGSPAKTVYIIGSLTAEAAVRNLAARLNCSLEVRKLPRKGPLEIEKKHISNVNQLKKGDAVIAFSRKEVLRWREELASAGFSVAMVYGNLSPEVRRAQAALFREEKADILVGTDALAMGLNMPISRVIFTTHEKFDGEETVDIPDWLAQQIGGRAGRFGIHEVGYVNAFGSDVLKRITEMMTAPLEPIRSRGFWVAPTLEHLEKISQVVESERLYELLLQFKRNIDVHDSFFLPASLTDQIERAGWLDSLALTLEEKFLLSLVPLSLHVGLHGQAYEAWCKKVAGHEVVRLQLAKIALSDESLQLAEDTCKLYSGYVWLSYRLPSLFPDGEQALKWVREMSAEIDHHLKKSLVASLANARKQKRGQEGDSLEIEPREPVTRADRRARDDRREEKTGRLTSNHQANTRAHEQSMLKKSAPSAETRLAARRQAIDNF